MTRARDLWQAILARSANSRVRIVVASIGALGLAAVASPAPAGSADIERSSAVAATPLLEPIESGDEDHFDHDEPAPVSPPVDLPAGLNEIEQSSPWAGRWGPEIEPLATYEPQTVCIPGARPGVAAFASLLSQAYPQSRNLGITRACDIGARSEHKEGRAYDWGLDVSVPAEREAAQQVIAWLLATDEHGNDFAMARRLGVMYIIWDNHIWSSTAPRDGWRLYTGQSPHTDHVHLSFDRAGAMARTSFWNASGFDFVPSLFHGFTLDDFPPGFHLGGDTYRSELGASPGEATPWRTPVPPDDEESTPDGATESSTEPDDPGSSSQPDGSASEPALVAPEPVEEPTIIGPVLEPVPSVETTIPPTTLTVPLIDDVVDAVDDGDDVDGLLDG